MFEGVDDPVDVSDLDNTLELPQGYEPKLRRVDDAEEAVAAAHEPEQLDVLGAAAAPLSAVSIDERQFLDI